MDTRVSSGLEGVVATETRISHVDGEKGRLVLSGYDVETLAGKTSFEQVYGLLTENRLPKGCQKFCVSDRAGA